MGVDDFESQGLTAEGWDEGLGADGAEVWREGVAPGVEIVVQCAGGGEAFSSGGTSKGVDF